jgi:hypothetical protein
MNDIKCNAAGRKRIDLRKTVLDSDMLRMAADLHSRKQNKEYWKTMPVPKCPNGRLRCQALLQIGVFAMPIATYITVAHRFGCGVGLFGLGIYYLLFHWLKRTLSDAIFHKRLKEEDLDRGRYAFTKLVVNRLGVKPEEVTLEVVLKATCDFGILVIYGRNMPTERKNEFMRHAYGFQKLNERLDFICAYFEQTKHLAPFVKKQGKYTGLTGSVAVASTATAVADTSFEYEDEGDRFPTISQAGYHPTVNTATGMPMIENSPFDFNGNVYGTGHFGFD